MTPDIVTRLVQGVLIAALAIAVVTDVRQRKIYNWLTFPAFALGFILNGVHDGMHGLLFSLKGVGIASISGLLLLLAGATGAADVKLFLAIGALMGPRFTMWTLISTAIAGGVLGLIYAARRGVLGYTVRNALLGGHVLATTHSPETVRGMASMSKAGKMPYAPAVALGAAIAAYLLYAGIVS